MPLEGVSWAFDGTSSSDAARRPPPDVPQTDAGKRLTSALLPMMQRTRRTADAELMPLEGVSWTFDGTSSSDAAARQTAALLPMMMQRTRHTANRLTDAAGGG